LLFGPMGVVFEGVVLAALPTAVVAVRRSESVVAIGRRFSVGLSSVAVVWGATVLCLPGTFGRLVLGDNWNGTAATRAALALSLVAEAVTVGAALVLRAHGAHGRLARARLVGCPVTIAAALVLAGPFGSPGAASGFAIGYAVVALAAWADVRAMHRRHAAAPRAAELALAAGSAS
jgi:hypothetical protein